MFYRLFIIIFSVIFSMAAAVSASAQDRASMESYMCNYVDGKGYEDLMKVAAKWNKWAGENNPAPYAAYVLSPVFATFEEVPEAVWIGFSPTSTGMGAIVDKWYSEGGSLIAEFNKVVNCGAHTLGGSRTVRPYENEGQGGVVQISACKVNEGVSWSQVGKADQAWADFMTEHGIPGGLYRWGAGPGTPKDSGIDFYSVWITESMEQHGAAWDAFREIDSASQDYYSIYGDDNLYSCDKSRIYYGVPVGGSE